MACHLPNCSDYFVIISLWRDHANLRHRHFQGQTCGGATHGVLASSVVVVGLGIFALDELEARSLLHRLSASGGVVVELPQGGKAIVVSADLYGMYLYRLGGGRYVSDGVEWVRYGEVKFRVSRIIKITERSYWHLHSDLFER